MMTQMEVARQSYTVSCGEQGTSITHTEATEQYFSVMLFLMLRKLVAPTFEACSFFLGYFLDHIFTLEALIVISIKFLLVISILIQFLRS